MEQKASIAYVQSIAERVSKLEKWLGENRKVALVNVDGDLDEIRTRIKKLENAMTAQACRDAGKQFYEQVPETTQRRLDSMLDKVCEDYKRLNLQRSFEESENIYKQHGDNLLDAFIVLRDAVKEFLGA